jgi:hypothetical protein
MLQDVPGLTGPLRAAHVASALAHACERELATSGSTIDEDQNMLAGLEAGMEAGVQTQEGPEAQEEGPAESLASDSSGESEGSIPAEHQLKGQKSATALSSPEDRQRAMRQKLILQFRIEKKTLLKNCMKQLRAAAT